MEVTNSYELLKFLKSKNLIENINADSNLSDLKYWWWKNALSFEIVIGAILTQNTRWNQVEKALENLRQNSLLNLESLSKIPLNELEGAIKSVGFCKQKAQRIKQLCKNIINDFADFETFKQSVSGEWLISQKGIGAESRDAILNYALGREVMVVDAYTKRLLGKFGYEFESYDEIQEWLMQGIDENYKKVCDLYGFEIPLNLLYARFHAKITEYMKG